MVTAQITLESSLAELELFLIKQRVRDFHIQQKDGQWLINATISKRTQRFSGATIHEAIGKFAIVAELSHAYTQLQKGT